MQDFYKLIAPPATKPRLAVSRIDGVIKPPNNPFDSSPERLSEFPRCPSSRASKHHVFVMAALLGIILLPQWGFSQQLPEYAQNGRLELCAVTKNLMPGLVWPNLNFRNPSPFLWGSTFDAWNSPTHFSDLPQVGIAPLDAFFYTSPLGRRSLNSPAYAVEGIEVVRYRGIFANDDVVFLEREIVRTTAVAPLQRAGAWSSRLSFEPQTRLKRTVEIHIREVVTLPTNPNQRGPINIAF